MGCGRAGAEHLPVPAGGAAEHLCAAVNALDKCRVFPRTAFSPAGPLSFELHSVDVLEVTEAHKT